MESRYSEYLGKLQKKAGEPIEFTPGAFVVKNEVTNRWSLNEVGKQQAIQVSLEMLPDDFAGNLADAKAKAAVRFSEFEQKKAEATDEATKAYWGSLEKSCKMRLRQAEDMVVFDRVFDQASPLGEQAAAMKKHLGSEKEVESGLKAYAKNLETSLKCEDCSEEEKNRIRQAADMSMAEALKQNIGEIDPETMKQAAVEHKNVAYWSLSRVDYDIVNPRKQTAKLVEQAKATVNAPVKVEIAEEKPEEVVVAAQAEEVEEPQGAKKLAAELKSKWTELKKSVIEHPVAAVFFVAGIASVAYGLIVGYQEGVRPMISQWNNDARVAAFDNQNTQSTQNRVDLPAAKINNGETPVSPKDKANVTDGSNINPTLDNTKKTEIAKEDFFDWTKAGGIDFTETFKIAPSVGLLKAIHFNGQSEFVTDKIEVNNFLTRDAAFAAKWGADFTTSPVDTMYDVGLEQTNNGGRIVYFHASPGGNWPGEWVRLSSWYKDAVEGNTDQSKTDKTPHQGEVVWTWQNGKKVGWMVDGVTVAKADDFNNAPILEFHTKPRPIMRDLSGVLDASLLKPGETHFVSCGGMAPNGEGYPLLTAKTIVSAHMLESVETAQAEKTAVATYGSNEYYQGIKPNMDVAAKLANDYFSEKPLKKGDSFSYLEAMNNFGDQIWIGGKNEGFIKGAGACDIATLLKRGFENFAAMAGHPLQKNEQKSNVITESNEMFELSYIPHSEYPNKPADEIVVESFGQKSQSNADFKVKIKGDKLPDDFQISVKIVEDGKGNYEAMVTSNYDVASVEELLSSNYASIR